MAGWHSSGLWADTSKTGSASESSIIYAAPPSISAISGTNAGHLMVLPSFVKTRPRNFWSDQAASECMRMTILQRRLTTCGEILATERESHKDQVDNDYIH
jgi:hypothetical protein